MKLLILFLLLLVVGLPASRSFLCRREEPHSHFECAEFPHIQQEGLGELGSPIGPSVPVISPFGWEDAAMQAIHAQHERLKRGYLASLATGSQEVPGPLRS